MKASSIYQHEKSFRDNGIDSFGKKFILTPETVTIPGESTKLTLLDCRRDNNDNSFYYQEVVPKKRIVLHFTAGYLKGDIATLTTPYYHVSVPFIVARSGDIYNPWASKYWSYHLGNTAIGGNTEMSSSSIAIEISNIGFLIKDGKNFHTIYSNDDVYCEQGETGYYTEVAAYRGQKYYATFTNAQYRSLILLLRYLTARYNIPRVFLSPDKIFEPFASAEEAANFSGICSHVNFRPTGKWDIGPAFNWKKLMFGVWKPVAGANPVG